MFGYDNLLQNKDLVLDLPFYEGSGAITRDQSKIHHQDVDLVLAPVWDRHQYGMGNFGWGFAPGYDTSDIGSFNLAFERRGFHSGDGISVITTDGTTNHYVMIDNLDSTELDVTSEDYSICGWLRWENAPTTSVIIIGRYFLDNNGWEIYLTESGVHRYLSVRHHHAGGAAVRSACYSDDWTWDIWYFWAVSRQGTFVQQYRNGIAVTTTASVGGLEDPESCNQDLVIGIRYTKNANQFKGSQQGIRMWKNRFFTANEWLHIFEKERRFFGV